MTEFEQQVAEALKAAAESAPHGYGPYYSEDVLDHLAPRVAVAILHAAEASDDSITSETIWREQVQAAGLRALRMSDETLRRGV